MLICNRQRKTRQSSHTVSPVEDCTEEGRAQNQNFFCVFFQKMIFAHFCIRYTKRGLAEFEAV